jgi:glycosyltransferase involved in cell wall biosynthesis
MTFVSFVISSVNRPTLGRTIQSIVNQNDDDWNIQVIFDGHQHQKQSSIPDHDKITYINAPQTHSAGFTRNYGMQINNAEWYAFVDDDDWLRQDYVQRLKEEISLFPDVKTVIWRIQHGDCIVPDPGTKNFRIGRVGIAFAIHRDVYHKYGLSFINQYAEDFYLLDAIRSRGLPMVISPYVLYIVRHNPINLERFNFIENDEQRARINENSLQNL